MIIKIANKIGSFFLWLSILLSLFIISMANMQSNPIYEEIVTSIASLSGSSQKSFLDISSNMIFWTLITFFALVSILTKYAWKPMIEALDHRAHKIQTDMDFAKKSKEETENLLNQQKNSLFQAKTQAKQLIYQAQQKASQEAKMILNKSQQEANSIILSAQKEAKKSKQNAIKDVKNEIVSLSALMAQKIISKSLSLENHEKIVNDAIHSYEKM